MAEIKHFYNGNLIDEPRNWQDMEIECDFQNRKESAEINMPSLNFVGDIGLLIRQRAMNGLSNGLGMFEGDPYRIEIGESGNPAFVFDGYLDFADDTEFIGCNEIKVALKKRKGENWLNDVADGFSFRYLFDKGIIKQSDFVKVPYVINYIPDGMQMLVLSMSLFMMTKELIESVKTLAQEIGSLTNASMPTIGTSVGLGAGVVTAWDLGDIIYASIKLASNIAYTIALIFAIKKLIEQIIEQLVPKKRYHLGMRLYTLFQRACEFKELQLQSNLLNQLKDWVLIPQKGHIGGKKPTGHKGQWIESGVPNGSIDTFGDLIREWKKNLNADFKIKDGVFYFEREDFWQELGNYQIADVFTEQPNLQDKWKPNVDEVISNYNINWAYDVQDQNTMDNQNGRVFQSILEPKITLNKDLVNLKNLEEVAIGYSMGTRKNELTEVEKVVKGLAKFVDKLTSIFGGGTNFESQIEERNGSLLLSSHFLSIPKVVVMSGGKLAKNQREKLSSENLWNNYHSIRCFAEINGKHNQWRKFEKVKVPFCLKDFISLFDKNYFPLDDGKTARIDKLKWSVRYDYALIDFRVNEKYTDNLTVKNIK